MLVVTAALLGVGTYGTLQLEVKFDYVEFLPQDSRYLVLTSLESGKVSVVSEYFYSNTIVVLTQFRKIQ